MRWAALAPTAVAVVLAASPAAASHTDLDDLNDTDGKLDIERVEFAHEDRPTWRIRTFGKWSIREIWDSGYFVVYLDTKNDGSADYYGLARSNGRRLQAHLFKDRVGKPDKKIANLKASKKDGRTAQLIIPLGKVRIGDGRTEYRWHALTILTSGKCRKACIDRAPDDGWVDQELESGGGSSAERERDREAERERDPAEDGVAEPGPTEEEAPEPDGGPGPTGAT